MSNNIDLEFRPATYFRPQKLEDYLLSGIKGDSLRRNLKSQYEDEGVDAVREYLENTSLRESIQKDLEGIHPSFMGGNYLPDTNGGEVEIARIRINSTTHDVTSVYASFRDGGIHYRVVDEYGGDTLTGHTTRESTVPLTLGELTDFFLSAWSLVDVLEMNFESDLQSSLDFFRGVSDFYPDFDRLCRQRVMAHYESTYGLVSSETAD